MGRLTCALFALLLVAGCGQGQSGGSHVTIVTPGYTPSASAARSECPKNSSVNVTDSNFEPSATFEGIQWSLGNETRLNTDCGDSTALVRSWVDKKTGVVRHQLYVTLYYLGDWKFWRSATDDTATPLEVVDISSKPVSCASTPCLLVETIGVTLSDKMLRKRADSGFQVQLGAKSGEKKVVAVSAAVIAQQLAAIQTYKAQHGLK